MKVRVGPLMGTVVILGMLAATAGCGTESSSGDDRSGTFTVDVGTEPNALDPLLKVDGPGLLVGGSVYESLTLNSYDGPQPQLATSWKREGNSWIFELRPDVKFHNGQQLTADDVVASWKRAMDPENLRPNIIAPDTQVTAVDDSTVSITSPDPDLTTPIRAAAIAIVPASVAAPSDNTLDKTMIGTGPYVFESWTRTQEIRLTRFGDYWGDQPQIENVVIKFSQDAAVRLAALEAGESQMAMFMPAELSSDKFTTIAAPTAEVSLIRVNSLSGPFTDIRVREAASLAIDRELLVSEVYGGYATVASQPVAEYVSGHDDSIPEPVYDPERARQLLEEAGQVGVSIRLVTSNGRYTSDVQQGTVLAQMLTDVGFKVKLEQPPLDEWVDEILAASKPETAADLTVANASTEVLDSSVLFELYVVCGAAASTICNEQLDALANQALKSTDPDERERLYGEAWNLIAEEDLIIPIAVVPTLDFINTQYEWEPLPGGFLRVQDIVEK